MTWLETWLAGPLVERLGWTLIHTTWELTIIAIVAAA